MWFIVFFLPVLSSSRWKWCFWWLSKVTVTLLSKAHDLRNRSCQKYKRYTSKFNAKNEQLQIPLNSRSHTQSSVFAFREHCFRTLPFSPSIMNYGVLFGHVSAMQLNKCNAIIRPLKTSCVMNCTVYTVCRSSWWQIQTFTHECHMKQLFLTAAVVFFSIWNNTICSVKSEREGKNYIVFICINSIII